MNIQMRLPVCFTFVGLFVLCASVPAAPPEKDPIPGAPHLLPEDTLLYVRLDDADDFRESMAESSLGQMMADPKLKPLVSDVYLTLEELFNEIGEYLGISLDELMSIPKGQCAAAMMPRNIPERDEAELEDDEDDSPDAIQKRLKRKRREQNAIAGLFMIQANENVDKLLMLVQRLEERLQISGYVRRESKVDDTILVRWLPPREGRPEIEYFNKDDTVVLGVGHQTASKALDHWLGISEEPTLADAADFGNIMSRCVGAETTRPQITFFVDPYHIIEKIVKRGGAAGFVWPILEELGLSKIRGIGGSSFRGGDVFQDITHFHLLIDSPRDGFFGVIRPSTGSIAPPSWVPSDVTSYSTIHWDFATVYDNLNKILAKFQGEDPLKRFIEDPVMEKLRLDVRKDLLENLTGRYASAVWLQPPVKINSQVPAYGFELKDPVAAKNAIARVRAHKPDSITVETVAGQVVYRTRSRRRDGMPEGFRRPEPGFMIVGDWLIFSDSSELRERMLLTHAGSLPPLSDVSEFDLVLSELGGKLDGEQPFLISFVRGADYMRQLYELAKSKQTRQFLGSRAEKNQAARKFGNLLQRSQFPPFSEFEKYFAPGGVLGYDDPTGLHYGMFNLKP